MRLLHAQQGPTAKCHVHTCDACNCCAYMVIQLVHLLATHSDSVCVKQLAGDLLFCYKNDTILAQHADCCTSIGDSLHSVLHLIEAPLGTEDGRATVISARHTA
jgi:hypothetical protein